jgi:RimJ/RimL family protein N-acetyltransferase
MAGVISRDLTLEGKRIRLEPLHERHAPALHAQCNDPLIWEFTFQPNPLTSLARTQRWVTNAGEAPDTVAFAIINKANGAAIGSTRYIEICAEHRKLEIGWTFLSRSYWGTGVNAECKRLLLHYAFEIWGAVRVQFKAEARNQRSRRAIERIGAVYEGTLRNYRIRADTNELRDTAFFSIIAAQWPLGYVQPNAGIRVANSQPAFGCDKPA